MADDDRGKSGSNTLAVELDLDGVESADADVDRLVEIVAATGVLKWSFTFSGFGTSVVFETALSCDEAMPILKRCVREAGLEEVASVAVPEEVDDDDDLNDGSVEIDFAAEPPAFNVKTPEPDDFVVPEPEPGALWPASTNGEMWGYIDRSGEFAVEPKFASAGEFSEGLAQVSLDGHYCFIGPDGAVRFTLSNPEPRGWLEGVGSFSEGLVLVCLYGSGKGHRYTFADEHGELLGPPRFEEAYSFSGDLAAAKMDGRWGFIGAGGEWHIQPRYEEVFSFSEGLAMVDAGNWVGYIDAHGEYVIEPQFQECWSFSEGLAWAQPKRSANGGYINRQGEFVIPSQFAHGGDFHDGRARVLIDNKWAYVARNGDLICEPSFDGAEDFSEGLAAVQRKEEFDWGYIDRNGVVVIPSDAHDGLDAFGFAGPFRNGLAFVQVSNLHCGYIDRAATRVRFWDVPLVDHVDPAEPLDDPELELFPDVPDIPDDDGPDLVSVPPAPTPQDPPGPQPPSPDHLPVETPIYHSPDPPPHELPPDGPVPPAPPLEPEYSPHLPADHDEIRRYLEDTEFGPFPRPASQQNKGGGAVKFVVAVVAAVLSLWLLWLVLR